MAIRIGRTLPPAAASISFKDILGGVDGLLHGNKEVTRFEQELKDYFRVPYCSLVSSGKAALVLILQVLHDLSPERNEVLIPAYTCYSVPSAIVRAGLKVRLCDIATDTLDFVFAGLEEQLGNPGLLAVIPTHLFGLPANVARVREIAERHGVWVVEDAAQAMGAEWDNRRLGTLGDVGLFSLGRGKAFSTVEGGIILTDDNRIGDAIERRLTNISGYGPVDCLKLAVYSVALALLINPLVYWLPCSLPFLNLGKTVFDPGFPIRQLSPFQAGMARGWKARIQRFRESRREKAREITNCGIPLSLLPGEILPDLIRFPILCANADAKGKILEKSRKQGLGISDGYPDTIDGIKELGYISENGVFPGAKDISKRLVTLPIHPFVKKRDIQQIVQMLKEYVGHG